MSAKHPIPDAALDDRLGFLGMTGSGGAVDLSECPTRRLHACRCLPKCRVCGFGKHMAIHGPVLGQLPGSKPYGHEFEPGHSAGRRTS